MCLSQWRNSFAWSSLSAIPIQLPLAKDFCEPKPRVKDLFSPKNDFSSIRRCQWWTRPFTVTYTPPALGKAIWDRETLETLGLDTLKAQVCYIFGLLFSRDFYLSEEGPLWQSILRNIFPHMRYRTLTLLVSVSQNSHIMTCASLDWKTPSGGLMTIFILRPVSFPPHPLPSLSFPNRIGRKACTLAQNNTLRAFLDTSFIGFYWRLGDSQ